MAALIPSCLLLVAAVIWLYAWRTDRVQHIRVAAGVQLLGAVLVLFLGVADQRLGSHAVGFLGLLTPGWVVVGVCALSLPASK